MELGKRIRVLVVDDSMVFREVLSRGLSTDPCIEVVAAAGDPYEARDRIIEYKPDVMTCDVEMPRMNGIEFIRKLMPQYPLPVIVVSAVSNTVFEAMKAGAIDFVTKPDTRSVNSVENFINDMIEKVKVASVAKVLDRLAADPPQKIPENAGANTDRIIAIGASTGGTEAISSVLGHLPQNTPGIVIVQHIPPVFSRMFAERLDASIGLNVREARTGDVLENGHVLIAPGDRHMRIRKTGNRFRVECFEGDRVNGHCPSVDVLFESVAKEAGRQAVGLILTGMGYDGAKGLLSMRRKGARTIGQDESSSVVYGMPKAAFNVGAVERQVSLDKIPRAICSLLNEK